MVPFASVLSVKDGTLVLCAFRILVLPLFYLFVRNMTLHVVLTFRILCAIHFGFISLMLQNVDMKKRRILFAGLLPAK